MRKSANSLSPIAILPNTPPPARIFAQPETPTTPLTDGAPTPTIPVVELPPGPIPRPTSIRSGSGSGQQLRFSSLLDPGDITPITSPLPSVTSSGPGADGSIYTIFGGGVSGPEAPPGTASRRRSSVLLPNSASNGSATSANAAGAGAIAAAAGLLPMGAPNGNTHPPGTSASVSASLANSASAKSRSRRSSELSQHNWRCSDRSASASMKSHASASSRKRSSSTHIELNGPPVRDRPRCLKSSFLRRKCKEYAELFIYENTSS
ncbi:hypothetical protein ZHAS_00015460 [Anopheles sinensis]|uniref:Uncharacterized protein n=1 Tax=Anopheles sinensis TaxID=74873 RepID=A0A084WBB1_ANOSI|nr:hypothetical protein ZHAS_00015460 [Anopheles sinensis]